MLLYGSHLQYSVANNLCQLCTGPLTVRSHVHKRPRVVGEKTGCSVRLWRHMQQEFGSLSIDCSKRRKCTEAHMKTHGTLKVEKVCGRTDGMCQCHTSLIAPASDFSSKRNAMLGFGHPWSQRFIASQCALQKKGKASHDSPRVFCMAWCRLCTPLCQGSLRGKMQ